MTNDLGSLLPEIETVAKEKGLVLFHGTSRLAEDYPFIEWETESHPGYGEFLDAALACGVKLVCIHPHMFGIPELEEAIADLAIAELPPAERRLFEKKLNELRIYAGFTCGMELTFDHQENIYAFHLRTPWRIEFLRLLDVIDGLIQDEGDDADEPMGGGPYFSRN
jgi:hypothetical protein